MSQTYFQILNLNTGQVSIRPKFGLFNSVICYDNISYFASLEENYGTATGTALTPMKRIDYWMEVMHMLETSPFPFAGKFIDGTCPKCKQLCIGEYVCLNC